MHICTHAVVTVLYELRFIFVVFYSHCCCLLLQLKKSSKYPSSIQFLIYFVVAVIVIVVVVILFFMFISLQLLSTRNLCKYIVCTYVHTRVHNKKKKKLYIGPPPSFALYLMLVVLIQYHGLLYSFSDFFSVFFSEFYLKILYCRLMLPVNRLAQPLSLQAGLLLNYNLLSLLLPWPACLPS